MDDFMEFFVRYIIFPTLCILFVGLIILLFVGIPLCIKEENETSKKVEECFMQEVKTKDCEYILWKYEIKSKQPKNRTTAIPVVMPMVVK